MKQALPEETQATVAYPSYYNRGAALATIFVMVNEELGSHLYREASPLNNLSLTLQRDDQFTTRPIHDQEQKRVCAIVCTFRCRSMADVLDKARHVQGVLRTLGIEAPLKRSQSIAQKLH